MGTYIELQCDGLVGPTHNYAGLSHGNIASAANAETLSYPRRAALQGLEKMRLVASLGIAQLVLPPQMRPRLRLLGALGFTGSPQEMLETAYRHDPKILQAAWSASGMWAANMATVSPARDTQDGMLHLTPSNLASILHRQQEAAFSRRLLEHVFGRVAKIHPPLPVCIPLTDEGAANHMRLCEGQGGQGVEIFVYGKESKKFPCRQTKAACEAIARLHGVQSPVFAQQSMEAIDAGVFHNDVIAMSNERLLIYHANAFADEAAFLNDLRRAFPALEAVRISEEELPLDVVVGSYFFNSQLLSIPGGGMVVVAPEESRENRQAHAVLERLKQRPDVPVDDIHYLDLRESMKNGGGPACLRLRVVLEQEQVAELPQGLLYSDGLHERLAAAIESSYPDTLNPDDLRSAEVMRACHAATAKIAGILQVTS